MVFVIYDHIVWGSIFLLFRGLFSCLVLLGVLLSFFRDHGLVFLSALHIPSYTRNIEGGLLGWFLFT